MSQLQQIAEKMEKNAQVQEELKSIIFEHGGNLDLIQENIEKAVENTSKANEELQDAADYQLNARLAKIRLGVYGVIAAIGYSILGIPGLIIGGIVGLFKTPS